MGFVYVLRSLLTGERYIGSTSMTPEERLGYHNRGLSRWTSSKRPWELIYYEKLKTLEIAQKRERFFKTGKGFRVLKSLINDNTKAAFSPTTTLGDPPKT